MKKLLSVFRILLLVIFIPIEALFKFIGLIMVVVISLIYACFYPILKHMYVAKWVKEFVKYSTHFKSGYKLTKKMLELWT